MHMLKKVKPGRILTRSSTASWEPLRGNGPKPDDYLGNREPALSDLLKDPLVARLMASDGVDRAALEALTEAAAGARAALGRRP